MSDTTVMAQLFKTLSDTWVQTINQLEVNFECFLRDHVEKEMAILFQNWQITKYLIETKLS